MDVEYRWSTNSTKIFSRLFWYTGLNTFNIYKKCMLCVLYISHHDKVRQR